MSKLLICIEILLKLFGGFPYLGSALMCSGSRCCPGYIWSNKQSKCIECRTGYVGKNCDYQCPPPSYGARCQSTCVCENALCHHIFGCATPTNTTLDIKTPVISSREWYPAIYTRSREITNQTVLSIQPVSSTKPVLSTAYKYLIVSALIITLLLLIFCLVHSILKITRYFKGKKHNLHKTKGANLNYESLNFETRQRQSVDYIEKTYEQLETAIRYEGFSRVTLFHDVEKCTYVMQLKTDPLKAKTCTHNQYAQIPNLTTEKNDAYLDPIFKNNDHNRHSI